MNRLSLFGGISTLLISAACTVDHDAASVEIQFAAAPSSSCEYSIGALTQPTGFFDPLQPNDGYYHLVFQVRNNMILGSTDAATFGPLGNARDQGTGANIVGFEGCWYIFQGEASEFGGIDSGAAIDCTTIPAQAGSLPAVAQADAALGQALVGVDVLTGPQLKAIFGSDFDVATVAADSNNYVGYVYDGSYNAYQFVPILKAPGAAGSGRPSAWGANYPSTLQANLIVQLRGIYSKQGGGTGYTNWVSYPINFCPSCLNNICGNNIYRSCGPLLCSSTGTCPASGVCPSGSPCNPALAPYTNQQSYVDWGATGSCLPAQAAGTVTCTSVTVDPNCPSSVN